MSYICQSCFSTLTITGLSINDNNILELKKNLSIEDEEIDNNNNMIESNIIGDKTNINDSFIILNNENKMIDESILIIPKVKSPSIQPIKHVASKTSLQITDFDKSVKWFTRISDIIGNRINIDQPLCTDCIDMICSNLNNKIKEYDAESSTFQSLLSSPLFITNISNSLDDNILNNLIDEEKLLLDELNILNNEHLKISKETKLIQDELLQVDTLESEMFITYNKFTSQLSNLSETSLQLTASINYSSELLERLSRTNIYDDAFSIGWEGHFGTMNGLRLGTLPAIRVEWNEINAALGQTCLLMVCMARVCNFKFNKYKLIPMGSFSKMARLDDPASLYELYGSDLSLGRIFWYRRFHIAMEYFIQSVKEFADWIELQDSSFHLHYRIVDDRVGDISVKLTFNSEEQWTKSMKFMLVNLKLLLAWTAKNSNVR